MSRILIVSDAWHPQTNGVVRTLEHTSAELAKMGHTVEMVGPDIDGSLTFPLPTYPEIKLEMFAYGRIRKIYRAFNPDYIHIATEGPLGWAARRVCLMQDRPFSTAYHTAFPEYVAKRSPRGIRRLMKRLTYMLMRRFHAPSGALMVATPSITRELSTRRFHRIRPWSRGVDTTVFKPYGKDVPAYRDLPRPIAVYVGRVAVEKNLDDLLSLDMPGSKVIIGDGPDFDMLKAKYPKAHFLGKKTGEDLARHYAGADVFVFPSRTDTFGLVLLEGMACGLPVAAYPAPGPRDIFADAEEVKSFARLDEDLGRAVRDVLAAPPDPEAARAFASRYSWASCTGQFLQNLQAETQFGKRRTRRIRRAIDFLQSLRRRFFGAPL
ncbi:MAG: glycosyltransferase [Alphaproteobacteria bacterium]|nr:glycosyltransferase [Alphaproteobacteria bacterium]